MRLLREKLFLAGALLCASFGLTMKSEAQSVHVTRFWHNHQPIYWPEWNGNGDQNSRVQYAQDSIAMGGQSYPGSTESHPTNNLVDIFGKDDRRSAYQTAAKGSLEAVGNNDLGFAMSYSGSLIDNVRSLGNAGNLGYGSGWNWSYTEARKWNTTRGSSRLDMLGFTYHHSLAGVLPKSVVRKEIQLFKQAWWKAWGGNSDLSDHSKGFFPTEMAYSPELVDVLVDEGYEWVIVASHHLSRTCPTYLDQTGREGSYSGICHSPPNKADLTGPSPTNGWWYSEPNPCNAAWNVAPYAYQLHWTKYVNPNDGGEKKIIVVPSDDVQSYVAGYSGAQVGLIDSNIAPYSDGSKPSLVMPSTDGDNAWGGGSSSYYESTPSFFGEVASRGYGVTSPQDFVNQFPPDASDVVDVEPGAWCFPEGGYGSAYFLKWIEPPLDVTNYDDNYPNTKVDFENADAVNMKYWIWGPIMAGTNWCETAEQIWEDENAGQEVQSWKIAYPYDWDGSWTSPTDIELGWHIFLAGFDSGFGYYGGAGNDDEVKTSLATRRAQEKLWDYVKGNLANDRTPPTIFRPQRFPWNPGSQTFGWFNPTPTDGNFLKDNPSEFYVWSLVFDLSGINTINIKVRIDNDGFNPVDDNQNDIYAGGNDVGAWVTIPMTTRALLNDPAQMTQLADNGEINYFIAPLENADLAYAKITCDNLPNFKGKLLDYYIEATDNLGNTEKSDIFHVWVEDDGVACNVDPPATPMNLVASATSSTSINVTWDVVANATSYVVFRNGTEIGSTSNSDWLDINLTPSTQYCYTVLARNASGDSSHTSGVCATTLDPPPAPDTPTGLSVVTTTTSSVSLNWNDAANAEEYVVFRDGVEIGTGANSDWIDYGRDSGTKYCYTIVSRNITADSSSSTQACGTTLAEITPFALDGTVEYSGYQVSDNGMIIHAAVRSDTLYVATWTPSSVNGNDHFIFASSTVLGSATTIAPWAKAGQIALPDTAPYIASEANNSFIGWFNTGAATVGQFRGTTNGQLMEGTMNLAEVYGSLPSQICVAAVAYQDADNGILASQAPAAVSVDGNLDPGEFLCLNIDDIRDENANGTFDVNEATVPLEITGWDFNWATNEITLTFSSEGGASYHVESCTDLQTASWADVASATGTAVGQSSQISFDHTPETRYFFRVVRD